MFPSNTEQGGKGGTPDAQMAHKPTHKSMKNISWLEKVKGKV